MKIFISGPISGTDDYPERFGRAQLQLEKEGWFVENPALAGSALPADTRYEGYMQMAFDMLDKCEAVYFLSGWEKSHGASMEYGYSIAKGKIMIFQKEADESNEEK